MIKIKELFNLVKGNLQSSKCTIGEFNFITASKDWKKHNEFTHDCEALVFAAAASGSLGRTHYVNGKFIASDLCFIITPKNEKDYPIDLKFYQIIFETFKDDIVKATKAGTSKEAIGLKALGDYKLPYFTFSQQQYISKKFLSLNKTSLDFTEETLNQLEIIKDLRQSFLREAMQGKLVSNETSDGKTGADLLAEIQAEKAQLIKEKKIKKSKPLPPISEDEIPFDIPENWTWCRLGEVIEKFQNGISSRGKDNGDKVIVLRLADVKNCKVTLDNMREIKLEKQDYNRYLLNSNDILITRVNGSIDLVGNFNYIGHFEKPITACDHFIRIEINSKIISDYIYLIGKLQYIRKNIEANFKTTSGQKTINQTHITNLLIPIPPFEVQKQIVSKFNELMQYCDNLENSVKESQQYNEMLLQQVLREALEGKEESKPQLKINKTCDNNDTAILASYIIQELNTPDFGRTKLQKIIHLAEYHCRLETPLQYYKKTAGPYSKNLENDIENLMRRNKLYDSKKEELKNSDKSKVNYIPLSGAKQINSFFTTEFKDQKEDIDNLLKKFNDKPMEFCEMISTMYAVWNNRLIKGEIIDNEELKKDFLAWDPQKIKFLDKLDYSIEWIKKEGLEPTGFGKYI